MFNQAVYIFDVNQSQLTNQKTDFVHKLNKQLKERIIELAQDLKERETQMKSSILSLKKTVTTQQKQINELKLTIESLKKEKEVFQLQINRFQEQIESLTEQLCRQRQERQQTQLIQLEAIQIPCESINPQIVFKTPKQIQYSAFTPLSQIHQTIKGILKADLVSQVGRSFGIQFKDSEYDIWQFSKYQGDTKGRIVSLDDDSDQQIKW